MFILVIKFFIFFFVLLFYCHAARYSSKETMRQLSRSAVSQASLFWNLLHATNRCKLLYTYIMRICNKWHAFKLPLRIPHTHIRIFYGIRLCPNLRLRREHSMPPPA